MQRLPNRVRPYLPPRLRSARLVATVLGCTSSRQCAQNERCINRECCTGPLNNLQCH
jgi:hypothetical protein